VASPPEGWAAAIANISASPTVRLETAMAGGSADKGGATAVPGDGASNRRWIIGAGSAAAIGGETIGAGGSPLRGEAVVRTTAGLVSAAVRCTVVREPSDRGDSAVLDPRGDDQTEPAEPAGGAGATGDQAVEAGAAGSSVAETSSWPVLSLPSASGR